MNLPTLATERLKLRPLRSSDLERLELLCGNYEVSKMLSRVPHPYDRVQGEAYLKKTEEIAQDWRRFGQADFAVSQEGQLIGVIVLRELQEAPGIGYWLGEPYWRKGYMTEALAAALRWVFAATGIKSLRAEVMKDNAGSKNVLKKLGFTVVGDGASMSLARGNVAENWHMELVRQNFKSPVST
ncbi:GNAT family N-acetyltransferase [Roseibium algae]|uniref:GNAT family N-acetyltransferase n=1 Tax=Roseibium algae TaxID=3123038 RepID=A0ABU8TQQ3_9HYPH